MIKNVVLIIVGLLSQIILSHAAEFKKEYRMQVTVGPLTYWGQGAARFAELVGEKTGGRIRVKPYYGSQLLKGAQLNSCQMVAMGAVDCALESTINVSPVVPEMNIFSLPFFISGFADVDRMENGATGRSLFALLEKKGVKPLAWGENGFRQLTNRDRSILSPSDLAGLKIRVVGSPIFIDIFRGMDADPINMNWGDAVTAFQQGTVDGQENPIAILLAVQISQYQRYLTVWNYLLDPLVFFWNKDEWEKLPADVQAAIQAAAREAARFEKALVRAGLDGDTSLNILKAEFQYTPAITDPLRYLEGKGMIVSILSEKELKAFRAATARVRKKWIEKIGDDIYSAAQADLGLQVALPLLPSAAAPAIR